MVTTQMLTWQLSILNYYDARMKRWISEIDSHHINAMELDVIQMIDGNQESLQKTEQTK